MLKLTVLLLLNSRGTVMEIMIKKRDGHFEPLSVEKTKRMIAFACLGLDSCDPLELEMDAKLQFVDGMTTKEIQKTLVQIANLGSFY